MGIRKSLTAILVTFAAPLVVLANPSPPVRYTGAPGDKGTCTSCHSGTANSGAGKVTVAFPAGLTYTPGAKQRLTVTVADPDLARWGFELTARLASNLSNGQAGAFTSISSLTTIKTDPAAVQFIETASGGTQQGTRGSATWQLDWTPPPSNVGNVVFYVAGLAANGSGTGGDRVYTASYAMSPAAVSIPTLSTSPASLAFNYVIGGTAPAAQNVSVSSSGAALNFTASDNAGWLSVSPTSGTTPGTVQVTVNPSGLAAGTYNGSVTITATGASGSPKTIPVTLTVSSATAPTLTVTPASLSFAYRVGDPVPAAQNLSVGSSGTALNFTAAASGDAWLAVTPASGTTPGTVAVSVNPAGMPQGTYNGTVTISASGASGSPRNVAVALTVNAAPVTDPSSFAFNIVKVENTGRGQLPKITFSVTDPTNNNQPYNILTHPAFTQTASGASRIFMQIGWDTREYTNTGSGSELTAPGATPSAAQPIAINALSGVLANSDGTYTVTSTRPIPNTVQGTAVVAMEGHPAGQDATGAWTLRVPVKSVYKYAPVTGTAITQRRTVVDTAKCKSCHGTLSLHGNNRTDEVQVCVVCHNANATDIPYRQAADGPEASIHFQVMVHSIHAAKMRSTKYVVIGRGHSVNDFSSVDFPADLRDCQKCHNPGTYQFPLKTALGTTVNTQSVMTAGAPTVNNDPTDDMKITTAAATCSACHDSSRVRAHMVRKGASFETLQQNIDSGAVSEKCNTCHGPGQSKDVSKVHRLVK